MLLSLRQNCSRVTMTELGFDVEKEGNPALAVVRNREFWTKLAREVKVENLRVLKVFAKRFGLVKATLVE